MACPAYLGPTDSSSRARIALTSTPIGVAYGMWRSPGGRYRLRHGWFLIRRQLDATDCPGRRHKTGHTGGVTLEDYFELISRPTSASTKNIAAHALT
jgi:hypothetical protein